MKNNKVLIISTTLEKWNDVISLNQEFLKHYIYRGQANSQWGLQTSLERLILKHHGKSDPGPQFAEIYEGKMLREFIWKYPLYEKNIIPNENDYVEWLSLMQHFGAPTRLLDFTDSLYVALFMCLDDFTSDSACLWGINKTVLNNILLHRYLESKNLTSGGANITELEIFARSQANKAICSDCIKAHKDVLIIRPKICNERLSIQQGLFLMPTNISCPFEENLNGAIDTNDIKIEKLHLPVKNLLDYSYTRDGKSINNNEIFQFKIIIPHKFKYELCNLLEQINITSETLYPGLSGMAKSLTRIALHSDEYTK